MECAEKNVAEALCPSRPYFFGGPTSPFVGQAASKAVRCHKPTDPDGPAVRNQVETNALAEVVQKDYPDCQVLSGTSTAGIASGYRGHNIGLPWGVCRSSARIMERHQIEGALSQAKSRRDRDLYPRPAAG
jgi:orotate phosphoribosyltransferase